MKFKPGDFEPMKLSRAAKPFDDANFAFEPKLDGMRVLAYAGARGVVRLESRSGREITEQYPDVCLAVAAALDGVEAVLDGELCVHDPRGLPSFAVLLERETARNVARAEELSASHPATYYAFDLLAVDGQTVVDDPLEWRREALADVAGEPDEGFRIVTLLEAGGRAAFREATRIGFEGIVAKRRGSPYQPGVRSRDWVKVKKTTTADLVVGAWYPGGGRLTGTLGSLAVGAYDADGTLRYVGRVGTGFTEADRDAIAATLATLARKDLPFANASDMPPGARGVAPRIVVEVEYHEVTRDGKLRAPALKGVRVDKRARECLVASELPPLAGAA